MQISAGCNPHLQRFPKWVPHTTHRCKVSACAGERQPHVLRAAAAADHEHEQRSRPPLEAQRQRRASIALGRAAPHHDAEAPCRRSDAASRPPPWSGTRQRRRLSGCTLARSTSRPPARSLAVRRARRALPTSGSSSAVRAKRTNAASSARRPPSTRASSVEPARIAVAARRRGVRADGARTRRARARAARSATRRRTRGGRRRASTAPPCPPPRAPPGRSRDRRPGGRRSPSIHTAVASASHSGSRPRASPIWIAWNSSWATVTRSCSAPGGRQRRHLGGGVVVVDDDVAEARSRADRRRSPRARRGRARRDRRRRGRSARRPRARRRRRRRPAERGKPSAVSRAQACSAASPTATTQSGTPAHARGRRAPGCRGRRDRRRSARARGPGACRRAAPRARGRCTRCRSRPAGGPSACASGRDRERQPAGRALRAGSGATSPSLWQGAGRPVPHPLESSPMRRVPAIVACLLAALVLAPPALADTRSRDLRVATTTKIDTLNPAGRHARGRVSRVGAQLRPPDRVRPEVDAARHAALAGRELGARRRTG